ncbi:MAG: hypothetical protein ACREI3_06755 [Nitrospirales bacterium]
MANPRIVGTVTAASATGRQAGPALRSPSMIRAAATVVEDFGYRTDRIQVAQFE